jgi:hypothetical protein
LSNFRTGKPPKIELMLKEYNVSNIWKMFWRSTWVVWKVLGHNHRRQQYRQDFLFFFLNWYTCRKYLCETASYSVPSRGVYVYMCVCVCVIECDQMQINILHLRWVGRRGHIKKRVSTVNFLMCFRLHKRSSLTVQRIKFSFFWLIKSSKFVVKIGLVLGDFVHCSSGFSYANFGWFCTL